MEASEEQRFVRRFRRKWAMYHGLPDTADAFPAEMQVAAQMAVDAFDEMREAQRDSL